MRNYTLDTIRTERISSEQTAADAVDQKGDRLFAEGREAEANECWDQAINLRLRAILL